MALKQRKDKLQRAEASSAAARYSDRQLECIATIERLRSEGHVVPKVLYGGAMYGGKSFLGTRYAVQLAEEHPGIRGYLCRVEAVSFKRSTMMTMMQPPDEGFEVLSRPGWSLKKADAHFIHENGSRLDYGGLGSEEDREKVKSMNLTFAFIDEASEVDQLSARLLESRCARQPGFEHLAFALYGSNPEPCWLQADFIDNVLPGHAYVQALPTDNPSAGAAAYIRHLEETYSDMPALLDAYLNGNWGAIGASDAVFPGLLLAAAVGNVGSDGICQWGVDVARFGEDKTVVYERIGTRAGRFVAIWGKQDTRETSDKIKALYAVAKPRPEMIAIDDIGLGGGVVDNLTHDGLPVRGVNVGEHAEEPDKFFNLRAELAWHLRIVLEADGALPNDPILRAELGAIKWAPKSGRIAVTPKEQIKDKLGRSPDRADAVILAFATAPVRGWTAAQIAEYAKG